jgi:chromosome segregation ATPase
MKRQADLDAEVAGLGAQLGQEMSSQSMGAVAMLRAYKTKIKVLEEGLERLAQENSEKQHKLNQHELKSRGILDELTKSKKLHGSCKLELEKVRKNEASAASKVKQLTREIAGYKREASKTASARDQSVQQSKTLEVKLNRALFDVEKYKAQVSTLKKNSSGTSKEGERELKRVQLENKRLKQQKKELLTAFKKQFKLIDILKRQKMHIEAAKLLSFTEEEFVKALELDA